MTESGVRLSRREAARLGATNGLLFGSYFFKSTFRQEPGLFHPKMWELLDGKDRYVAFEIFRDGAKTSTLRVFLGKRISYGISRTILYLGKSENKAVNTIGWLAGQARRNKTWTETFNLRFGQLDNKLELELWHGVDNHPIRVIGMGIEGSVRGTNIDDYRPDLIVLDDVLDESNCSTLEQRNKISARLEGAVKRSLAPRSESPLAKLVFINTPIDPDDPIEATEKDEEWEFYRQGCFMEDGGSAWPTRYSKEELETAKRAAIKRNKLSIWLREMECLTTADETRYFKMEWLKYWVGLPERMTYVAAVDPSPPKDEEPERRAKKEPDPEVIVVVARWGRMSYLVEYTVSTDPDPEKTYSALKGYKAKYPLQAVGVEVVAYQKTLEWYFKHRMQQDRSYLPVVAVKSTVNKVKRIRQRYSDIGPDGNLWVHESQRTFIEQFRAYPAVAHEDVLDAVDIGLQVLDNLLGVVDKSGVELDDYQDNESEDSYQEEWSGACP